MIVKNIIKIVLVLVVILILVLAGFFVICAVKGSKNVMQFTDENGQILEDSIAERVTIPVNGRDNTMIIRGRDSKKPVILFISGGPGVPQYWLNEAYQYKYPNHIEDEYVVCWWDYRGEGLSYSSDIDPAEITMDQLVSDACVVCDYLKERFCTDRVYLMAHSNGTNLALRLAMKHPEYFNAYFSMGQNANTAYGRHEAGYYFMKDIFEKNNDEKNLKKLESLVETVDGHICLKDKYNDDDWEGMLLSAGCATTRDMRSDATGIFLPHMLSGCYTLSEKINYWRGKLMMTKTPYSEECKQVVEEIKLDIPLIFLSGYYDYTTPVSDAKDMYDRVEATDKAFYLFNNSAHSPLWEENEQVLEVMRAYVR